MMCLKLAEPAEGISEVGHGRIQRGGQGVRTPLKNHKNIGFPSNIDPDPLKITKLPSQHLMLGITGTPAKHHLNGVALTGRWWPTLSGIPILSPFQSTKKNVSVGPPLTKLSGSVHVRARACTSPCHFKYCVLWLEMGLQKYSNY